MSDKVGFTCPDIDKAQRAMRRLAWRVKHRPESSEDEVSTLLNEGLQALERVREANKRLRDLAYPKKERA